MRRMQESNERRLKVEVEKVNRPAGTILNVLVNNLKIGELTLNSGMEAEFALRTDKGQPVPNVAMARLSPSPIRKRIRSSAVFSILSQKRLRTKTKSTTQTFSWSSTSAIFSAAKLTTCDSCHSSRSDHRLWSEALPVLC